MIEYGPPQKFKLVDTRNGAQYGPDDLLCNGLTDDSNNPKLQYAIEFEGVGDAAGHCERVQFTGLKDRYGTEVYGGDVLLWNSRLFEVFWRDGLLALRLFGTEERGQPLSPLHLRTAQIIGNRWEPRGNIIARAAAQSPPK